MAAMLVCVVAFSSLGVDTQNSSARLRTEDLGSTLDDISTAIVAAEVAQRADFIVATSATKQTENLSSQVTLPTIGETALAKRQVVETAGSEDRTVRSYIIQPGDTMSEIASRFGITTNTIKWANGLSDADALAPGEKLVILPVSGLFHTVSSGDTAESLADKYSSNAAQIISFNNAEATGLKVGQKIIIPDGVKAEAVRQTPAYAAVASLGTPTLTTYSGGSNGYYYGYCTWYVATRRSIPGNWGNASNWYYAAQASGFRVGSTPVKGAIAWTGSGYAGHVGVVEDVRGDQIVISDMNYAGWGVVTTRVTSRHSYQYIY